MNPSILTVYKSPYTKIRLGKDHDGGYIIADIPDIKYKVFLAGGISDDISFEDDFLKKYIDTECFAFDGTIDNLPHINNKITFIKKNIGDINNDNITNIHDIINVNDSIFVKMDIEGGEVPWIKSLNNDQLNKFDQVVMEFHWPFADNEIEVFDKININHYLIHFHGNNYAGTRVHKGIQMPDVFECTYLHKKFFIDIPEFNTDTIPSIIDMKNSPDNPDINMSWPPFVN
jgi:hypothetical protein